MAARRSLGIGGACAVSEFAGIQYADHPGEAI